MLLACFTLIVMVVAFFYWQSIPVTKITKKFTSKVKYQSHRWTEQQRKEFLTLLAKAPVGNIDISTIRNDQESLDFANELNRLLRNAGWQTGGVNMLNFVINPKGLTILVHSVAKSPIYATGLQHSFKAIGLYAQSGTNNNIPADTLNLIVGLRANPKS